jgi:[protein-PII] uridylyltransferase
MAVAVGPLGWFLTRRAELVATAEPGPAAARALADLTDEAVLAQSRAASARAGAPFALFALGGYGARRLLPHSDVDLLVISPGAARDLEPLVRGLFYPLWDAGLELGHQIRTPAQQARAVRDDLPTATAFLTARFLAGDRALADRALAEVFRRVRKEATRLLSSIEARERPGSPYLLEPDLKDGAGGQRDIDELVWRAAIVSGAPAQTPGGLAGFGVLRSDEMLALRDAQAVLTTARWLLHRAHHSARNAMDLEDALDTAFDADAVQRSLERVHHTLLAVRERAAVGGARRPASSANGGFGHPDAAPLSLREIDALAVRADEGLDALERAAYALRLDAALSGFGALMTLRRPGLSHRYTVGAHCLRALAAALDPGTPAGLLPEAGPVRDALVVAALSHDAGKAEPAPDHSGRGAGAAAGAACSFGLDAETAAMAATLVREHLLLSEAATRDLTDEDVVLDAAARIGDPALVAPLFALTAADMRATGDGVWTPWRAALVAELAGKIDAALSAETDGAGIVARASAVRAEATRRALAVGASRTQLRFIEGAPLRYLERRTPEEVLRDARLVQRLAGPSALGDVAIGVEAGRVAGTWLVDVVARDRPGLFATVSGALALSGLGALSAEAFTDRSGIALDTFTVEAVTLAAVGATTWETLERTVRSALGGALPLDERLEERRRHYPTRARRRLAGAAVEVGEPGGYHTPVRVRASDRVGLLHDLARAFQAASLDIRRATITTTAGVADDVFEVVDAYGRPPSPETLAETLVPSLLAAARAPLSAGPRRAARQH